jgi:hypothetical protein
MRIQCASPPPISESRSTAIASSPQMMTKTMVESLARRSGLIGYRSSGPEESFWANAARRLGSAEPRPEERSDTVIRSAAERRQLPKVSARPGGW